MAGPVLDQARIDKDTPSLEAITIVAAGVLLSDFAILLTPALAFAIAFICRTSSLVHSRRTAFFALGILLCSNLRSGAFTSETTTDEVIIALDMKHARACGYRVAGGTLCACQKRRQAARPSASQRGYGTDWQALRAAVPHAPCTACAAAWKPGYHLDHRIAGSTGGTDDPTNLHWLCHGCHSRKTAKLDGGFGHRVAG